MSNKVRTSVFNFTINSNKSPFKQANGFDFQERFKASTNFILDAHRLVSWRILKDESNPEDSSKNIKKMKVGYQFEIGKQTSRLHCHGSIFVEHSGIYSLDRIKIIEFYRGVMNLTINLRISAHSDNQRNFEIYSGKESEGKLITSEY